MEHKLAMDKQFAERYLLGELTDTERDAYEEHFFECQVCAEEVQTGSQFIRAARDVFAKEPVLDLQRGGKSVTRGRFWKGLFQPAPAMAFAAVVLVSGLSFYQQGEISRLKRPLVSTSELVISLGEPRDAHAPAPLSRNKPFSLAFDIPPGAFSFYEMDVLNELKTKTFFSSKVSAQEANNTITIHFRPGTLPEGNYVVVIQGVNSDAPENIAKTRVASYDFALKLQK